MQFPYFDRTDIQFNENRLQTRGKVKYRATWNLVLKSDKRNKYANEMSTINHRINGAKNFARPAAFQ
jgi:hypothetical protein